VLVFPWCDGLGLAKGQPLKLTRRTAQVWNWLPAFRAVAEFEHLPTASKEVNLSASALSRSVKLLEDDLGIDLFAREGRQLELTTAGRRLLGATRSAMRTVEAALDQILSSESAGTVHVSAPGPYTSLFILPALRKLREQYPDLLAHVRSTAPAQAEHLLVDGGLDIFVTDSAISRTELRVTKLSELEYSVYASDFHPLTERLDLTVEDLLEFPFVGPPESISDHFPLHLPRKLGMVVEQLHVAVQVCAQDGLLAVLPDVVARDYRGEGSLVRLPIDVIPSQPLYAVSRKAAAEPKRIDLVLRAVAQTVEEVKRGIGRSTMPPARSTMRPPAYLEGSLIPPRPPAVPADLSATGKEAGRRR
jgi:DNA-binding transcriptional LysR family regulator